MTEGTQTTGQGVVETIVAAMRYLGTPIFHQRKCLGKVDEVATRGNVVVLVSHNAEVVRRLCTRVIWLESGKLVEDSRDVGDTMKRYLGEGVR